MGKGEMVKSAPHYLPDVPKKELKVKTVAEKSKSWAANGVDVLGKVIEADAMDRRFGMMLRMALAYGLRAREVIELCPWNMIGPIGCPRIKQKTAERGISSSTRRSSASF